jgi:cytochrome P450
MKRQADAAAVASAFDASRLPDEFYEDPYPVYAALREHDPVHRCPDGAWFLTRHADLDRIYRDRQSFSSDKRVAFAPKFGRESPLYAHHTTSLVFNDAPYHTRVRRQIVGALTPQVLKAMQPGLVTLIDGLIDAMQARGAVDLIEDFAAAIPVEVIGNLLRVPRSERGALRGWSLAILGALEPVLTPGQQAHGERCVQEFLEYLRLLVSERRRNLGGNDDMLSRLIRDETGGQPLTEHELLHNCIFLLNAGHETTTNLIGNALHLLLTHSDELERLRRAPQLIVPCVEESSSRSSCAASRSSPAHISRSASARRTAIRRPSPIPIASTSRARRTRTSLSPPARMPVPECRSRGSKRRWRSRASSSDCRTCGSLGRANARSGRAFAGSGACLPRWNEQCVREQGVQTENLEAIDSQLGGRVGSILGIFFLARISAYAPKEITRAPHSLPETGSPRAGMAYQNVRVPNGWNPGSRVMSASDSISL